MRAGRGRPPMLMTGMVMPQNMAQYYNPNDKNMDGIPDVVQQRMGMMVRCLLPRPCCSALLLLSARAAVPCCGHTRSPPRPRNADAAGDDAAGHDGAAQHDGARRAVRSPPRDRATRDICPLARHTKIASFHPLHASASCTATQMQPQMGMQPMGVPGDMNRNGVPDHMEPNGGRPMMMGQPGMMQPGMGGVGQVAGRVGPGGAMQRAQVGAARPAAVAHHG